MTSWYPGFDFTRDAAGVPSEWGDLSESTAAILEQTPPGSLRSVIINQSTAAILEQSTAAILEGSGADVPVAFGHGTMVAGLVHLVAPTARIMPLKAFRADGSSTLADILRAIYFAADNGARVINMSFSLREASDELIRALNYATSRGVICIASVGNGEPRRSFSGRLPPRHRRWIDQQRRRAQPVQQFQAGVGACLAPRRESGHQLSGRPVCRRVGHVVQWRDRFGRRGAARAPGWSDRSGSGRPVAGARATRSSQSTPGAPDDRGDLPVPPPPPPAPPQGSPAATFLVLDADAVRAGAAPNFFTSTEVNEDLADFAARSPLRGFQARQGAIFTLPAGQVGNEGWFALKAASEHVDNGRAYVRGPSQLCRRSLVAVAAWRRAGSWRARFRRQPGDASRQDSWRDPVTSDGLEDAGRGASLRRRAERRCQRQLRPADWKPERREAGNRRFRRPLCHGSGGSSGALPELRVRVLDPRRRASRCGCLSRPRCRIVLAAVRHDSLKRDTAWSPQRLRDIFRAR